MSDEMVNDITEKTYLYYTEQMSAFPTLAPGISRAKAHLVENNENAWRPLFRVRRGGVFSIDTVSRNGRSPQTRCVRTVYASLVQKRPFSDFPLL